MSVVYLDRDDLFFAFSVVRKVKYPLPEQLPAYESQPHSVEQAFGALERIRSDVYYPTLHDKAASLFVSVAKGHYFQNGNKRLAITLLWGMFIYNHYKNAVDTSEEAMALLRKIFPEIPNFSDDVELTAKEDALYNLAFIVVESGSRYPYSFDEIKLRVARFLEVFFTPETSDTDST